VGWLPAFDEACAAAGRAPGSVVRSLLVYPPLRPWASVDGFRRLIDRDVAIGFEEFIAYPPRSDERDVFRSVVDGLMPNMRG
jgi:hypothetical protein